MTSAPCPHQPLQVLRVEEEARSVIPSDVGGHRNSGPSANRRTSARERRTRLLQFGPGGIRAGAHVRQVLVVPPGRAVADPAAAAARAAPYSARNRLGSLTSVASNSFSAPRASFARRSMSPSCSRAGASGPGVTAAFSVLSSASAAARNSASASDVRPSANATHAAAARRWMSICCVQYGSFGLRLASAQGLEPRSPRRAPWPRHPSVRRRPHARTRSAHRRKEEPLGRASSFAASAHAPRSSAHRAGIAAIA